MRIKVAAPALVLMFAACNKHRDVGEGELKIYGDQSDMRS
jgi:hypothetical protein